MRLTQVRVLSRIPHWWVVIAPIIALLMAQVVMAAGISFSGAEIRNETDRHFLNAQADVKLNSTIEAGLHSGVPLHFNTDVTIKKVRTWWRDKTVAQYRRTYVLVYYELTRHYRVSVVGEDIIHNFRSLFDALDYLGNIEQLSLEPFISMNKRRKYFAVIELSLDERALPLPLQPQILVSSAWRLDSQEYRWPID